MKYQNFIGFIIVLSLFSSCSAISDFFDKSKKVTETSKTVIDQVDKVLLESKTIYDDLNNLDPISRTGIIDNIKSSGYSVENYYNYFYLDSIQSELATNGSVKIEPYEGFIVDHLNKTNKNDTIYLANLYLTTLNWGNVMSIEYEVAKNDIIFYEFENVKSSKINEIEMVDGSEIRFKHLNLKRNDKINGQLKIINDGKLTLNITKNFYFKSNLKITIKKIKKNKIYSTKVIDSISTVKTVEKKVVDTVYNILNEKKYTLTPTLDITRNSNMNFPIIIESDKNVIGWGYWIGLDSTDIDNYSNLEVENEPLKDFAKSELTKSGAFNSLPKTSNTNIELIIKNESLDARSLNYSNNYAFFRSDVNFQGKEKKAEVFLTNRSKIYDYPIVYKIVTVNLETSIQEVDEVFITKKEYINLTLQINE